MKDNHAWFVDMFSLFKPPDKRSREALDSKLVKIGTHQLTVQPELKEVALKVSNSLVRLSCSFSLILWVYELKNWYLIMPFHLNAS